MTLRLSKRGKYLPAENKKFRKKLNGNEKNIGGNIGKMSIKMSMEMLENTDRKTSEEK